MFLKHLHYELLLWNDTWPGCTWCCYIKLTSRTPSALPVNWFVHGPEFYHSFSCLESVSSVTRRVYWGLRVPNFLYCYWPASPVVLIIFHFNNTLIFPFLSLALTQIVSSIYLDMRASYQSWALCFMWMMSPNHCRFIDGRETLH